MLSSNCVSNPYERKNGNPLADFVNSDFDPNYDVNGETHLEIYEKPKTVVNLKMDDVEGYLREYEYADMATARSIVNHLKFTKSFKRSFNTMKCDDTRYQFDSLPAERKTYENFWNKNLSLSFLLVKGEKHEENNTVTLKIKKVFGSIKKRKAEKLTRESKINTEVCYTRKKFTNYKKERKFVAFQYRDMCVQTVHEKKFTEVKSSVSFKEVKYQFPNQIRWSAQEISDLYQKLYVQMAEKLFLY